MHKKMMNSPKIYKIRIVFRWLKNQAEKNTFNAVRKMVLTAGLPFEPAKVNKNGPRLAYGPSPALGQRAEREYLDIYLQKSIATEEVHRALEEAAPKGLELLDVRRVPYPLPSVQNLAAAARYRVEGDFFLYQPGRKLEEFLNSGRVEVTFRAENGLSCVKDIQPFVGPCRTISSKVVSLTVLPVQGKWINPEEVIAAWLDLEIPAGEENFTVEGLTFIREGLFWQDSQGEFHLI